MDDEKIIRTFCDLFIENEIMKELLLVQYPDLNGILAKAKAEPGREQQARDFEARLRNAMNDKMESDRLMEEIMLIQLNKRVKNQPN